MTKAQFDKARFFILQQGDLFTRQRFLYHFEGCEKQRVLDILSCFQNEDGGFGNGLEMDILCPDSSGICTELAIGYLLELDAINSSIFDYTLSWILKNRTRTGDLPHPVEAVIQYPHGDWWAKEDHGRIMSIAGLLGKGGIGHPEISARAADVFKTKFLPLPDKLDVYSYPVNLYLEYAQGTDQYMQYRPQLRAALSDMLQAATWLHPLYFCWSRWDSIFIKPEIWQKEAEGAVETIVDDGGVSVSNYKELSSYSMWRPIWTLNMLINLKRKGLLF